MFIRLLIVLLCVGTIHSNSLASEREQQEIEELAYKTACEQATFTFRVDMPIDKVETSFFIHFTHHYLPFSCLSIHTKGLLDSANTVVIEPRPLEDEPLDQMKEAYEVFQKYCIDAEFHRELPSYSDNLWLSYYDELKEEYKKSKDRKEHLLTKMFYQYDVKFEDLSPLFILYVKNQIDLSKEKEKGMDNEIDQYALKHKKTRTGLDSGLRNFILQTPRRLKNPIFEQKDSIIPQLYSKLYYSKHPQEAEKLKKETENLDNDMWDATYKNGQFFEDIFNQDQWNKQGGDIDCVDERNHYWLPRTEEIMTSPDKYPSPVMKFMGAGHHKILELFEDRGSSLKILNQNGQWYPFPYKKLYQRFQEEKLKH